MTIATRSLIAVAVGISILTTSFLVAACLQKGLVSAEAAAWAQATGAILAIIVTGELGRRQLATASASIDSENAARKDARDRAHLQQVLQAQVKLWRVLNMLGTLKHQFASAHRKLAENPLHHGEPWAAMSAITGVDRSDVPVFSEAEIASLFEVDAEAVNYLIVLDERARSIASALEQYVRLRIEFARETPTPDMIGEDGYAAHKFNDDDYRRLRPRMIEMNSLLREVEAMIDENLQPTQETFVRLSDRVITYFPGFRLPKFGAVEQENSDAGGVGTSEIKAEPPLNRQR